jgi:DNA repair ATPase RecN
MDIFKRLSDLLSIKPQLNRIERKLEIMATKEEIKQLFADHSRENTETIQAAVAEIARILAAGTFTPQELEELKTNLETQITANQTFQDSIANQPPVTP